MSSKEIIIKLTPSEIFFNEEIYIDISNTNLPNKLTELKFNSVFWKLKQLSFDKSEGHLKAEIIDYFPRKDDLECYFHQSPKFTINKLILTNLRKPNIIVDAIKYYHKQVAHLLLEDQEIYNDDVKNRIFSNGNSTLQVSQGEKVITKKFSVYFKDSVFKTGFICFNRFIEELGEAAYFQIPNEYVLAEYDYIKSYFAKALKIKKYKVIATVKHDGKKIVETSARSSHIDLIDPQMIDSIKISRTLTLPKYSFFKNPDKSLFSSDEIFDTLQTDEGGNIFHQTEQDILDYLIDVKKVRNRKQLEYLAGKKQSTNEKLRFTLNPHFGFLFLLEGDTMNHFCWELLNSHATYIWSIEKGSASLVMQYKQVEMIINSIRNTGREIYKNSYRNNHLEEGLVFCSINHQDASSNFIDSFVKWKHKLDEKIV